MKKLKKLLALVLVAVMVLSFGALSASAAFTDTAASPYQEAISVLSGIKVIDGTTSTTYEPNGSLTRAAAAKVVTYMLLGPTNAALISSAANQTFSDVPTSHWASGYIDYCASKGIIAGTGDGTFKPEGVLTTLAFTKMLLVALGYNADIEGYVGSNWAINIASNALSAGVYDSTIPLSATATCTRDQAAQLAFKALKADMVQYTGGSTIKIGETSITTGAVRSKVTYTTPSTTAVKYNGADDGVVQFCEQYFKKLATQPGFSGGRNGYFWLNGATYISGFISGDVVLATKTGGTALAFLQNPANPFYVGYTADSTVTYYVNDYKVKAIDAVSPADAAYAVNDYVLVGSLATGTLYRVTADIAAGAAFTPGTNCTSVLAVAADSAPGVIVNFVDTDFNGKYNVISFVQKSVYQLAAAPTTSTSGTITYVNVGPFSGVDSRYIVYPAGLQAKDVITYYSSAGFVTYIEKATPVTGTINTYNSNSVTIDGTAYNSGALAGRPGNYALSDLQALIGRIGYTFYVDSYNNIVYYVAPSGAATLTNSYFVLATQKTTAYAVDTYGAQVLAPDGTVSTITVAKTATFGGTMTAVNATNKLNAIGNSDNVIDANELDGKLASGVYYTYTKNANGTYNLTSAQNQSINAYADVDSSGTVTDTDTSYVITPARAQFLAKVTRTAGAWPAPGSADYTTVLATSNTVFLYYNPATFTYVAYTGIANVPAYGAGGTITVLKDSTNKYATVVVCKDGTTSTAVGGLDTIFVSGSPTVTLDAFGTPLYTYKAVVNGVVDQSITTYVSSLAAGKLYISNDKANGVYLTAPEYTTVKSTALYDVDYAAGTVFVDATADISYILNSACVIYMYSNTTRTVTALTPEAAAAYVYAAGTDFLYAQATSTTDASLAYVYISVA